jgi:hypothetical protein
VVKEPHVGGVSDVGVGTDHGDTDTTEFHAGAAGAETAKNALSDGRPPVKLTNLTTGVCPEYRPNGRPSGQHTQPALRHAAGHQQRAESQGSERRLGSLNVSRAGRRLRRLRTGCRAHPGSQRDVVRASRLNGMSGEHIG